MIHLTHKETMMMFNIHTDASLWLTDIEIKSAGNTKMKKKKI